MRDYLDKAELLLLPLIAKDTSDCKKWLCPGLIGVYYKDTNKPHWEDKIIVVYNGREMNQPILNWNLSDYKYEKYEEYINNKSYYIYAYTVPPQFKKDFNLIINGDYSKISTQAKNRILEFHFKKHNGKCLATYKVVEKILNPPITETLNKKREYTDPFGEKEILHINQDPLS